MTTTTRVDAPVTHRVDAPGDAGDAAPAPGASPQEAVRHFAGQGLSNRVIAKRVGVSEATVRRWRNAAKTPPATHPDAPPGPVCDAPAAQGDAPPDAPGAPPAAHPADADAPATHQPTAPSDTPPYALAVPLTADLRAHLAVLAAAGFGDPADPAAMAAAALELLADAVRSARDYGTAPATGPLRLIAWATVIGNRP